MKPHVVAGCTTGTNILKVCFTSDMLLGEKRIFTGVKAKNVATVDWFLTAATKTYKICGEYARNKLPLRNKTLKTFAAIDPIMILSQKDCVMHYLLELPDLLVNVFTNEKEEKYEVEVRKLMCDNTLPRNNDEKGEDIPIVDWWAALVKKYPLTHRMVMSLLSIFHGPKVESSFSIMCDVIDKKANKMKDKTFSATQTIKYSLQAKHHGCCSSRVGKVFSRADKNYSPLNSALVTNMRNARAMQKSAQGLEKKNQRPTE